jgi:hypothetical protein
LPHLTFSGVFQNDVRKSHRDIRTLASRIPLQHLAIVNIIRARHLLAAFEFPPDTLSCVNFREALLTRDDIAGRKEAVSHPGVMRAAADLSSLRFLKMTVRDP